MNLEINMSQLRPREKKKKNIKIQREVEGEREERKKGNVGQATCV